MSYYKTKSYSLNDKELVAKVNIASNNIRPLHFFKAEIKYGDIVEDHFIVKSGMLTKREGFYLLAVFDLISGNFQFYNSVYYKYRYALEQTRGEIRNHFKDSYEFYKKFTYVKSGPQKEGITNKDFTELMIKYKKIANAFIYYLEETNEAGDFIIRINGSANRYFMRRLKRGYRCSTFSDQAQIFPSRKAAEAEAKSIVSRPSEYDILRIS